MTIFLEHKVPAWVKCFEMKTILKDRAVISWLNHFLEYRDYKVGPLYYTPKLFVLLGQILIEQQGEKNTDVTYVFFWTQCENSQTTNIFGKIYEAE